MWIPEVHLSFSASVFESLSKEGAHLLALLATQPASDIPQSSSSRVWHGPSAPVHTAFCMGPGHLNLGSHACAKSTLLMEHSPGLLVCSPLPLTLLCLLHSTWHLLIHFSDIALRDQNHSFFLPDEEIEAQVRLNDLPNITL